MSTEILRPGEALIFPLAMPSKSMLFPALRLPEKCEKIICASISDATHKVSTTCDGNGDQKESNWEKVRADSPLAIKAWKLYSRYGSCIVVGEKLKITFQHAKRLIDKRAAEMAEAQSPEVRARMHAVLVERWNEIYAMASDDKHACDPGSPGALGCLAVMAKCNVELARLHCLSAEQVSGNTVTDASRMQEVVERLRSVGIHSRAARMLANQAARQAGIEGKGEDGQLVGTKTADARVVEEAEKAAEKFSPPVAGGDGAPVDIPV